MPNSRPLSPMIRGDGTFDSPPATSGPSSPYPNRHSRLRRALRNTSDLAQEIARDTPVSRSTGTAPHAAAEVFSGVGPEHTRSFADYLERAGLSQIVGEADAEFLNTIQRGGPATQMAREPGARRRRRDVDDDERDEDGELNNDYGFFTGDYRRKRRKLDVEPSRRNPSIKYGHYGQVEAGKLKMLVISNDGGEHIDPRHPEIYLGAKNLLKLDKSVFCSVRNSAGVVLQHADGTAFSLEKLHVVGPEHGFTAPVREGLVYVSMDLKSLQPYLDPPHHARRSGLHEPPYRQRTFRASPERLSLSDALRDPEISAAARTGVIPSDEHSYRRHTDSSYYDNDPRLDPDLHCDPTDFILSSSSDPVTLLSDEECGPEDSSTQEVLDYRLRRMRLMQRRLEIESWDRAERWGGISNASEAERERERELAENPAGLNRLDSLMSRHRHPLSSQDEAGRPALPSSESRSEDPNVTLARFEIKKGKFKVAIKFDPPVSGRFVLLKMWSGRGNVDVQSVVAKGYGGPRFFPALKAL